MKQSAAQPNLLAKAGPVSIPTGIAAPTDERVAGREPRSAPLMPDGTLSGRALVIVIAIMTFLASLTAGTVDLIAGASTSWSTDVAREMTIQVRPQAGRDVEADLRRAADIARKVPGIESVHIYSKEDSERLVEPWLGRGLAIEDLPVPRLVVIKIAPRGRPDLTKLAADVKMAVPRADLDDHRRWLDRLAVMANALVAVGIVVLILVLTVTALAVVFATRAAMAGNQEIIAVLNLVGAEDGFIASEFQRGFLARGLKGGALGAGSAIAFFAVAGLLSRMLATTPGGDQIEALFGTVRLGWTGYGAIIAIAAIIALLTALVSRATVFRALGRRD